MWETNEGNNQASLTLPVWGGVCDSQTDLDLLEISLAAGPYHNVLFGSVDTEFVFKYEIAGVPPPFFNFKYKAILSMDRSWDNPMNGELFSGERSHSGSSGVSVSCE